MAEPDQGEVSQGKDGQWYWRLKAPNGEIIAQGEGFTRHEDAVRAGERVRSDIDWATTFDTEDAGEEG